MKKLNNEALRWFLQAERDLDDAKFSLDGKRFNLACFLAQQAGEKVLKAYLYSKGAEDVWGHSVADLCSDAGNFDKEFIEQKQKFAILDKYYIPTRYPNGLPGGIPSEAFDEDDAQKAISSAERLIKLVNGKIVRYL